MVLGTFAKETGLYGAEGLTVKPDGRPLGEAIAVAVENLPQNVYENPDHAAADVAAMDDGAVFNVRPMCYAAVCGMSCGQKRSPPFAGNGFPAWMGSVFRASDCLHCTSEGGIKQVISVPSRTQKMGGCKQKEIPRFQRLRKLKRIFMRFPHSP